MRRVRLLGARPGWCSSQPPSGAGLTAQGRRRRIRGGSRRCCFHDDPTPTILKPSNNKNRNNKSHRAGNIPFVDSSHAHTRPSSHSYYLLAHMNYARLRAPLDDPSMAEFRRALGPINALARATPGFVWSFDHETADDDTDNDDEQPRHQQNNNDDQPDPRIGVPLLERDPLIMPQLSLWTNLAALQHFAFKSGHAVYLKRRREWFFPPDPAAGTDPPYAVCWWWQLHGTGHDGDILTSTPTLREAFQRCQHLRDHGPSSVAFDFASAKDYPMP